MHERNILSHSCLTNAKSVSVRKETQPLLNKNQRNAKYVL